MISKEPSWAVSPSNKIQINSVAIDAKGKYSIFGSSSEFDSGCFAVYCYNAEGKQCWQQPISMEPSYQGVFWVAISNDGCYAAAGGELAKKGDGFLHAYSVEDGTSLLKVKLKARVNQVSLSHDGQLLLAIFDDTVQLYQLKAGQYQMVSDTTFPGFSCNSCALSDNGQHAVVSTIKYNDDNNTTTGKIAAFDIVSNKLKALSPCILPVGSMRVAITDSGKNWGASLHDGSCVAFSHGNPNTALWQYKPSIDGLELAYGFDMTQTSDETILLAVGANKSGIKQGCVYLLESADSKALLKWQADLDYAANPGISLDKEGLYVTATDGQPTDENVKVVQESPGHFYLFDGKTGTQQWKYKTTLMNWPMMINYNGDKIIGASDNGTAYFWEK
ncbi:MAG: hypothetical protein ABJH28_08625 [Paraglaciecola sp.]|uniref:WD40 repeat domain-containing protein n=1 Tax=Paraglaciecola sp. TaxID=1920173 RepID=UPI0032662495